MLLFGLFWTGIVGTFDGVVGSGIYRQVRALSFPTAPGTVVSSEITRHRGSKGGTTYGVKIRYTYEINGQLHEGDNYRYGSFSSSGSGWAHEAVRKYGEGTHPPVYYNPRNPSESVLSPGINGEDLFILLFLTPFNLIMLGLLSVPVYALWRKLRKPEAGGAKWQMEGRRLRVRLPQYSPALIGAVTAGVASFISIFVVAFGMGGHPSLPAALTVWGVVLGAGVGVGGWRWVQQRGGASDLMIDRDTGMVDLPATYGRKKPRRLPISEVANMQVETVEHRSSKGGTSYTYAVLLELQSGDRIKLADWSDESRANQLADWLKEKMGLADMPAPPKLHPTEN